MDKYICFWWIIKYLKYSISFFQRITRGKFCSISLVFCEKCLGLKFDQNIVTILKCLETYAVLHENKS